MTRILLLCCALALLVSACRDGGTPPPVATTVGISPPSVSLDAVGATQVVRASVADQNGAPMRGAALVWTSSSAAATVVGAGGDSAVVTAAANGSATITATSGSAAGTLAVQVAQVPATLEKAGGDGQTGPAGGALSAPLKVRVLDRRGAPVAGATVSFTVFGGGAVSPATSTSGPDGVASASWTLGTSASVTQLATAGASGVDPVHFLATGMAGAPATAAKAAGDGQTAVRGAAVPVAPTVVVRDAFGNAVAGVGVQFTVTGGGGSVTGGAQTTGVGGSAAVGGWTLGPASGTNTLTAIFPGTAVPAVVFTATGAAPGVVEMAGGDNQGVMAGTAVPVAPSVVVRDAAGTPLAGQTVTFTVTGGGGAVGTTSATTNASGVASAGSWVMGAAGGVNTLAASVAGLASPPVVFRGVGCTGGGPGYSLTLCFTSPVTASQRAAFQNAAARWSAVITGDLPDLAGSVPAGTCGTGSPSLDLNFDDLVIFAAVEPIDGPGAILGSAGPCLIRSGGGLPLLGVMRFDEADVATLEASGGFGAVILHEMGHVIGIGTMWSFYGLLQNPSSAGSVLDTYFTGANAIAGFDAIGGATYTGGQKVPVENTGGAGTRNAHWRESVLGRELMTGYVNSGVANPLSVLTVRSLMDLGYTVNVAAADAFSISPAMRDGADEGIRIKLHNDIYQGPRYTMDRQGRLTRVGN